MQIKKGRIFLYYCFEVASEITLENIEKIFGKSPELSKLEYHRLTPRYIQYKSPPLFIKIGNVEINKRKFEITAKIFEFGVITIKFITSFSGSLKLLQEISYELTENRDIQKKAEFSLKKVINEIKDALINPCKEFDWEDYCVFIVNRFDKKTDAKALLAQNKKELACVLRSDINLSEMEINDSIKNPIMYTPNDIIFIDWNAAFIYNYAFTYVPHLSYNILDVLEYAVIELLELRVYDDMLDKSLDKAYDDISKEKKIKLSLNPFGKTMNELSQVKLDISSIIDKVENALKLFGDLYLVKIYNAAASRFYLDSWKNSVKEKLNTVQNTYSVLYEQTNNRRMVILEVMIVLLFILDIIIYLRG